MSAPSLFTLTAQQQTWSGDQWGIRHDANGDITVWLNGVQVGSANDSTYHVGLHGDGSELDGKRRLRRFRWRPDGVGAEGDTGLRAASVPVHADGRPQG